MIKADKEKCIKCYKCINICPFTVLEIKEDGIPGLTEGKRCLECMHCAAICPVAAYSFDGKATILDKEVSQMPKGFTDNLENHIMTRRSYRHFEDRPVNRDLLSHVLNIAKWAPSAKNQHPTKYIVINSKETIKKMMDVILEHIKATGISPEVVSEYESGNNVVMGEAATLLIAYAKDNAVNAVGDTYIKMTTVELLLQSYGIGTCWCGYLTRFLNAIPKLQALLPSIPEGSSFYASFMMGYPKEEKYIHIPERLNEAEITWVE